jgi:hypothetical protein
MLANHSSGASYPCVYPCSGLIRSGRPYSPRPGRQEEPIWDELVEGLPNCTCRAPRTILLYSPDMLIARAAPQTVGSPTCGRRGEDQMGRIGHPAGLNFTRIYSSWTGAFGH